MKKLLSFVALISISMLISCNETENKNENEKPTELAPSVSIKVPVFNADNAYELVKKQVAFGPRVPGSPAQQKCATWIETELKKYADTVYVQTAQVSQSVSGKSYKAINIIATFNPQATNRILLLAHWDSRPWADEDTKDQTKPIDAADDGASGVAVLMEIATQLKSQKPNIGVDILLVDAEDVGKSEWSDESYCLGTQHWARNPHVAGYRAQAGICLDMVGAKGAQFPLEGYSQTYASDLQRTIWDTGNRLGFSDYFKYMRGGTITDDHLVINEMAKIPCVDIINLQPNGGFGEHWHTHQDNINVIDKSTLKAVGQTVMQVVYERGGTN